MATAAQNFKISTDGSNPQLAGGGSKPEKPNVIHQNELDMSPETDDEDDDSCFVCCEKFNKSTRAPIKCEKPDCGYTACKKCVRNYLLGTAQDPHCMQCNAAWNQQFMVKNLNKSFVTNDYNEHRKKQLLERELSKMPETMAFAADWKEAERIEKEDIREINKKIAELRKVWRDLELKRRDLGIHAHNLRSGTSGDGKKETRKFMFPCPDEECRGFLSSAYKCELCSNYTCPNCFEIVGKTRDPPDHQCDPDMVKTAELIKKTTRACPKCGERIAKSSGCDQMWCVKCHTAFSYKTGAIDNGVVHNPHYFQYKRENGGVPRNPGDVVCGGVPQDAWRVRNRLRQILSIPNDQPNMKCPSCSEITITGQQYAQLGIIPSTDKNSCRDYHIILGKKYVSLVESIAHITNYELVATRNLIRTLADTRMLRVQYLLGDEDKDSMTDTLISMDKRRRKNQELVHIYELVSAVGIELINQLRMIVLDLGLDKETLCSEMSKKFEEVDRFAYYINEQFKIIGVTFSIKMWQISPQTYIIKKFKFNQRDLKTST